MLCAFQGWRSAVPGDRDHSFQGIVINLSTDFFDVLSIDAAANTTDDLMLSWKWPPGQDLVAG